MIGRALLVAALVAAAPSVARAFPVGEQFDADPVDGDGAGGIAFTGAPRFAGHTCAVCHTDTPGVIGVKLEADQTDLFDQGYTPGMTYHLRVVMAGEWAAKAFAAAGDACGDVTATPYVPCDDNGFAFETDDGNGPVGSYKPTDSRGTCTGAPMAGADVRVLGDGTAITHENLHHGRTAWDFCWTAPKAGTGPVTVWIAAVDGNAGDGTANFPNNTTGDDVFAGSVPLIEKGGMQPIPEGGGCSAGGAASLGAALLVLAAIALRRRARGLVLAAIVALTGCAHVHPQQREILAKRKMTFGPDPAEDELDLHMQEAREGSSGGYGSAGGGCGCN